MCKVKPILFKDFMPANGERDLILTQFWADQIDLISPDPNSKKQLQ